MSRYDFYRLPHLWLRKVHPLFQHAAPTEHFRRVARRFPGWRMLHHLRPHWHSVQLSLQATEGVRGADGHSGEEDATRVASQRSPFCLLSMKDERKIKISNRRKHATERSGVLSKTLDSSRIVLRSPRETGR